MGKRMRGSYRGCTASPRLRIAAPSTLAGVDTSSPGYFKVFLIIS